MYRLDQPTRRRQTTPHRFVAFSLLALMFLCFAGSAVAQNPPNEYFVGGSCSPYWSPCVYDFELFGNWKSVTDNSLAYGPTNGTVSATMNQVGTDAWIIFYTTAPNTGQTFNLLAGTLYVNTSASNPVVSQTVDINGGNLDFLTGVWNVSGPLTISSGSLDFVGGQWNLAGPLTMSAGTVSVTPANSQNANIVSNAVTLNGGTVQLNANAAWSTSGQRFQMNGGSLAVTSGTLATGAGIFEMFNSATQATASNGATLSGDYVTLHGGSARLGGSPVANWNISVNLVLGDGDNGVFELDPGGALSVGGSIAIANSYAAGTAGSFIVKGGTLSGPGLIAIGKSTGYLDFQQPDTFTLTFPIQGVGHVRQLGTGTTILTGNSPNYAGSVEVDQGTLRVDGTLGNGSANVSVATGAMLSGAGTVGAPTALNAGAVLAPGNPLGTLTFSQGLNFANGSKLNLELGTSSDSVRVSGGVVTDAGSGGVTVDIADSGGFGPGTYTLIDFTGAALNGIAAQDFVIGTVPSGYVYQLSLQGSTLVLVAKGIPLFSWASPASITYGMALGATQLNATASFGGTAVTGTFTYTPTAGTVLNAGANQTLSVNFVPTDSMHFGNASATTTIAVTQAALTITADNKSRIYSSPDPIFTWTSSGFVNGDTAGVLSGAPALSSTDTPASSVGTYPITITAGTLAAKNYAFSFGNGTLTVTQATATALLSSSCTTTFVEKQPFTLSAAVTGANATGTVTFSDGRGGTLCSNVTISSGTWTCTSSALAVTGTGTQSVYNLTANYSGDGNYRSSTTNALTVTVLSAAEVLFRNGFEAESANCPIE